MSPRQNIFCCQQLHLSYGISVSIHPWVLLFSSDYCLQTQMTLANKFYSISEYSMVCCHMPIRIHSPYGTNMSIGGFSYTTVPWLHIESTCKTCVPLFLSHPCIAPFSAHLVHISRLSTAQPISIVACSFSMQCRTQSIIFWVPDFDQTYTGSNRFLNSWTWRPGRYPIGKPLRKGIGINIRLPVK